MRREGGISQKKLQQHRSHLHNLFHRAQDAHRQAARYRQQLHLLRTTFHGCSGKRGRQKMSRVNRGRDNNDARKAVSLLFYQVYYAVYRSAVTNRKTLVTQQKNIVRTRRPKHGHHVTSPRDGDLRGKTTGCAVTRRRRETNSTPCEHRSSRCSIRYQIISLSWQSVRVTDKKKRSATLQQYHIHGNHN